MGAPPSNQYRIEVLEKGLGELRGTMAEQIAVSVKAAAQEMQQNLVEQLTSSFEKTVMRLEDQMARSKENQDGFMTGVRGEQEKFQEEVRSALTSLKLATENPGEFVNSTVDFVIRKGSEGEGSGVGSGRGGGYGSGRGPGPGPGRGGAEMGGYVQQGHVGGSQWKLKKLDLPLFFGENPDGWIMRAERFFSFYKLTEGEQLEAAIVAMDGDALLWFQFENGRRPVRS